MTTLLPIAKTRQPGLTRAVIKQLGYRGDLLDEDVISQLESIAKNSADAGWSGFVYTSDTVDFYRHNRTAIIKRLEDDGKEFGLEMLAMIGGFNCLKDYKLTASEIGRAVFSVGGENCDTIQNALAWYALEKIARELCDSDC